MNGAQLVSRVLKDLGVRTIFSVSGNQVLPLYEASRQDGLSIVHTRHESAAVYAATAGAAISGVPGVALVSAGPGFLAGLTGLATARELELPVLYLSGDSPMAGRGTGHFQEFPLASIAGSFCKASIDVAAPPTIIDAIRIAWRLALDGIPGPVHLSLPVDMLQAAAGDAIVSAAISNDPLPSPTEPTLVLAQMAQCLRSAERPMLIARPSAARDEAARHLDRLAHNLGVLPIITESPRGLSDPRYAHLVPLYSEADCALVVAPSDFAVGYFRKIAPHGKLLHVRSDRDSIPVRAADHSVQIDTLGALAFLSRETEGRDVNATWSNRWSIPPVDEHIEPTAGGLHPLAVGLALREYLHPQDIVVLDGGEFCQWVRLALRDIPNPILWNSKLGGIGGAIPMALGAARFGGRSEPRKVFAFLGDGCAGYHFMEFETAVRYGLAFTAIIGNDARWGAEWHMQRQRYGHDFETNLLPVRYDQAAIALGARGAHAEDMTELSAAINVHETALPTCIDVRIASTRSPAPPA